MLDTATTARLEKQTRRASGGRKAARLPAAPIGGCRYSRAPQDSRRRLALGPDDALAGLTQLPPNVNTLPTITQLVSTPNVRPAFGYRIGRRSMWTRPLLGESAGNSEGRSRGGGRRQEAHVSRSLSAALPCCSYPAARNRAASGHKQALCRPILFVFRGLTGPGTLFCHRATEDYCTPRVL